MKNADFTLTIQTKRTPHEAFEAIRDVRGWWSRGIEGKADALGDVFVYRHEDLHVSTQQLTEVSADRTLEWLVTDATLSFARSASEWKGTKLRFEIRERDGGTEVRFTHVGLMDAFECCDMCSKGWTFYVGESLRGVLTTGKGKPDPASKARPTAVQA
jgi:hypothetical protein